MPYDPTRRVLTIETVGDLIEARLPLYLTCRSCLHCAKADLVSIAERNPAQALKAVGAAAVCSLCRGKDVSIMIGSKDYPH